ncbi:Stp1/IreP family PP2C-type Ser/Thr phosphatase [Rhodocytophaga rosea]|uniref:Stp1/IreP family PP2C-type Ser/Thr phosphatase n=1 Tax=Rhodocytophaga rosea TaxID=2704465 RepID=A0A6C0GG70_9BACT|nr:Stp1/IreP family PP2C-type Ser/Thr phosphatase [Rhodocytophaga rosea]QHT67006.1 Stp1/IreP family PP2C-type Ser/Thr phosphatase [Rhodocytophaga rosea]
MSTASNQKNFQFGNHTDVGKVREANEDYLGYFENANGHLFVVCDGMGGHAGGATASQLAVDSIRRFFEHGFYDNLPEAMRQSILFANQQIYAHANQNTHLRGMGTTCVVVIIRNDEVYYAHVGDSRLYLQSAKGLKRLTKDHSVVQEMVDQGMLKEEEAENHPRKNQLTRALGTLPEVEVEVSQQPFHPAMGDTLLICTDGLNGMINDTTIQQILSERIPIQNKAMKLVQLANDAGGYDNITVQLIQFDTAAASGITEDMATTSKAKHKKTKVQAAPIHQKVDPALIVLGVLVGIVFILFIIGYDQMSDVTPATSELSQEQPGATTADEETSEDIETEAVATEEPSPAKPISTTTEKPSVVKKVNKEEKTATTANTTTKTAAGQETYITHTVRAGETFSSVARRYNVTNQSLQSWNPSIKDQGKDLKSDVTQLRVKVRARHTVGAGDVLNVVAKKYGVSKELIMAANAKTADRASRGEVLVIPFAEKK